MRQTIGGRWGTPGQDPVAVTFGVPIAAWQYGTDDAGRRAAAFNGFSPFTAVQRQTARAAPGLWSAVADIGSRSYQARGGDTTYGFNVTRDVRAGFDFTISRRPLGAIRDGDGDDTPDLSGYNRNQVISPVPGTHGTEVRPYRGAHTPPQLTNQDAPRVLNVATDRYSPVAAGGPAGVPPRADSLALRDRVGLASAVDSGPQLGRERPRGLAEQLLGICQHSRRLGVGLRARGT